MLLCWVRARGRARAKVRVRVRAGREWHITSVTLSWLCGTRVGKMWGRVWERHYNTANGNY